MNAREYITKKHQEIERIATEVANLEAALEKFPDLEVIESRKIGVKFVSRLSEASADRIEYAHSCGCCPDAALYASVCLDFNGVKIFSHLYGVALGETANWYESGYRIDNLEETISSIEATNFPPDLKRKIISKCRNIQSANTKQFEFSQKIKESLKND